MSAPNPPASGTQRGIIVIYVLPKDELVDAIRLASVLPATAVSVYGFLAPPVVSLNVRSRKPS